MPLTSLPVWFQAVWFQAVWFQAMAGCCLALALSSTRADAQGTADLQLHLQLVGTQVRSEAPFTVLARLTWKGQRALSGELQLTFKDAHNRHIGTFRSAPLSVTSRSLVQLRVPALSFHDVTAMISADVRFQTPGRSIFLGNRPLVVSGAHVRALSVALSTSAGPDMALGAPDGGEGLGPSAVDGRVSAALETSSRFHTFAARLRLERFAPRWSNRSGSSLRSWIRRGRRASGTRDATLRALQGRDAGAWPRQSLVTSVMFFRPEELPRHALSYCAHDILVLGGDGFGHLAEDQLAAIARWVTAGGSLCVIPRIGMRPEHVRFLGRLTEGYDDEPSYLVSPEGRVRPGPGLPVSGIRLSRAGLGRLALVTDDSEAFLDPESPAERRVAAFLWQLRPDQAESVYKRGTWEPTFRPDELRPTAGFEPGTLGQQLIHSDRQRIPTPVIVLLCLGFLVLIGPVDYQLLGRLRKRHLTWIVFPVVALGFTALMVIVARSYLERSIGHGDLLVVDLGPGGEIVRENRFSMVYSGRGGKHVTPVADAIFTTYPDPAAGKYAAVAEVKGSFPTEYQSSHRLRKWKPELFRELRFEPSELARQTWPEDQRAEVDWQQLRDLAFGSADSREQPDEMLRSFQEVLVGDGDPGGTLYMRTSRGAFAWLAEGIPIVDTILFRKLSSRDPAGGLCLFARVAPSGGTSLEDAVLCGSDDDGTWIVGLARQVGDDVVLYRYAWQER